MSTNTTNCQVLSSLLLTEVKKLNVNTDVQFLKDFTKQLIQQIDSIDINTTTFFTTELFVNSIKELPKDADTSVIDDVMDVLTEELHNR